MMIALFGLACAYIGGQWKGLRRITGDREDDKEEDATADAQEEGKTQLMQKAAVQVASITSLPAGSNGAIMSQLLEVFSCK